MQRGINKAIIVGNLGADPEVRTTVAGHAVANLRLATSETWNDRASGTPVEQTEWHRVVLFKRLAEIAAQYTAKGSKLYIEGRLKTRKWQDRDGNDRYTTEILGYELQLLDSSAHSVPARETAEQQPVARPAKQPRASAGGDPAFDDALDEDAW